MHKPVYTLCSLCIACTVSAADNWPQGGGPEASFQVPGNTVPTSWSAVENRNIAWRTTLPETGQSTVIVWEDTLFFTTMAAVEEDSRTGTDIVAYCADARTGRIRWQRVIPGTTPSKLSGCFGDSTSPSPVTDGQSVVFFNASGVIRCFDFSGDEKWTVNSPIHGRAQPFLVAGAVIFNRAHETDSTADKGSGRKRRMNPNSAMFDPLTWNQLRALDMETGNVRWTTRCGIGIGCIPIARTLPNGSPVILIGRGGGHHPVETPHGLSLIDATSGEVFWTLAIPGFQATLTMSLNRESACVFHKGDHLLVDLSTGTTATTHSIVRNVRVRAPINGSYATRTDSFPSPGTRAVTQQSNLLVGDYHYFRRYKSRLTGRIHVRTGVVEYLEMPITPCVNEMKNSRGFLVMGDARSRKNNWGHHASPIPTAAGDRLFLPTMDGKVYVLNARAETFDERALLCVNDLGPAGRSWTRASLSFSRGRLYAHSIREVLCIGPGP